MSQWIFFEFKVELAKQENYATLPTTNGTLAHFQFNNKYPDEQ